LEGGSEKNERLVSSFPRMSNKAGVLWTLQGKRYEKEEGRIWGQKKLHPGEEGVLNTGIAIGA